MQVVSVWADIFTAFRPTLLMTTVVRMGDCSWQHLATTSAVGDVASVCTGHTVVHWGTTGQLATSPESLSFKTGLPRMLSSKLTDGTQPFIPVHSTIYPTTIITLTTQAGAYGSVTVGSLDQTAGVHSMLSTVLRPAVTVSEHRSLTGGQLDLLPLQTVVNSTSPSVIRLVPLPLTPTQSNPALGISSSSDNTDLMLAPSWGCHITDIALVAEPATAQPQWLMRPSVLKQLASMCAAPASLQLSAELQSPADTKGEGASTALVPYLSGGASLHTMCPPVSYTEHRSMDGGGTTASSAATAATATSVIDALVGSPVNDKVGCCKVMLL